MAKDKKTVIVYVDWISTFKKLEDAEAGKLIKHFFEYVNDLEPEAPDRLTELLFEPIKTILKRDLIKYEAIRVKNKENADKRWQEYNATACDRIPTDANYADNDIDNGIDKNKKEEDIYISGGHLFITWGEMNKLINQYGEVMASDMVTRVLNYRKNAKYKSLYLTAISWIQKEIKENNAKLESNKHPKLAI